MVETEIQVSSIALTYQVKGTLRYTAPELLYIPEQNDKSYGYGYGDGEKEDEESYKIFPTLQSDIYSFGGIMLQVRPCARCLR